MSDSGGELESLQRENARLRRLQITTTQKSLHTLPDADQKNLDALNRTRGRRQEGPTGIGRAD